MATFLVTGVAGFIGSNLAEALLARGHRVRGLDNFLTGKPENLEGLDGLEFLEGDVRDPGACREACEGVDYVLHEAALGSVPRSIEDPALSNECNVTGTLNLLVAARDAGVKRLVFAASSSAYGDTPTLPKVEDMRPQPLSPYALTKLAGEEYCRLFFELYGLETVSLRYFNVFGKRQDPFSTYAAVIPKFVSALLRGEPPEIYGDGEQTRDFTYIADVVQANLRACEAPREACGQVYNVAYGERISLNALYREIAGLLGVDLEP
ncbi:MAG: SDR family oxidoreductase, partial [Candidatus Dadabacteria bacterium]